MRGKRIGRRSNASTPLSAPAPPRPACVKGPMAASASGLPPGSRQWALAGSSWSARCCMTYDWSGRWVGWMGGWGWGKDRRLCLRDTRRMHAHALVQPSGIMHRSARPLVPHRPLPCFPRCCPAALQPAVYKFATPLQHSGFEDFTVKFKWGEGGLGGSAGGREGEGERGERPDQLGSWARKLKESCRLLLAPPQRHRDDVHHPPPPHTHSHHPSTHRPVPCTHDCGGQQRLLAVRRRQRLDPQRALSAALPHPALLRLATPAAGAGAPARAAPSAELSAGPPCLLLPACTAADPDH